jgi:hypothetical protein
MDLPGGMDTGYGQMQSPTAFTRVLIATQGFAQLGIVAPDYVIPNGFLPLSNGTINYAGADQVTYTALPTDGVTALKRGGTTQQNLATNFAGMSGSVSVSTAVANYEGLWWNAPAGSESGWGINFAHQGDVIFASWFTYDATGKGLWLVMTAPKIGNGAYSGTLFQLTGPAFNSVPFPPLGTPGGAVATAVGSGTLTFADANNGSFTYTVNGIPPQIKSITRQVFGPLPICTYSAQPNLAMATNYQDLWWAVPPGSEAGWGINLTHQGDTIFASWFTYDQDRTPMWLVVTANKTAPGTYSGSQVFRLTGPPFSAVPFPPLGSPGGATPVNVGTATFAFTDGNTGTFMYTVNGIPGTKSITRELFNSGGTICH